MSNEPILPLPFITLTGYLGSGKTTLLNRILADPSMGETAVLINEFGDVGIDHLLVESVSDDVVLLESGCVCCGVGDDFGTALGNLLDRRRAGQLPPFRRLLLETSGVADPAPIQQRVLTDPRLSTQLSIHSIVTVVDVPLGVRNIKRHLECAAQIAVADSLVVTKQDLASDEELNTLQQQLVRLNPHARILPATDVTPTAADIFEVARRVSGEASFSYVGAEPLALPSHGRASHADRYTTFSLRWQGALDWEDVKAWLEGLLLARGDSILRMKGFLHVRDDPRPVVVQGVQHALYPPVHLAAWPADGPRTELVFITLDFPREAAVRSVQQFFARDLASLELE